MKPADLRGDLTKIKFPTWSQPKYDGIRVGTFENLGIVHGLSNSLKPIRNKIVQQLINHYLVPGLDSEVFLVDALSKPLPFNEVSSFVMSENKEVPEGAKVCIVVFDSYLNPGMTYEDRLSQAKSLLEHSLKSTLSHPFLSLGIVPAKPLDSVEKALEVHQYHIDMGFEGTVFRSPTGLYKFNRSTLKEQYSLKLKPFEDSECTIIDFKPWYENLNPSKVNERGLKEKSKTLEGRKALDMLGAFVCSHPAFEDSFDIGTGFTQAQRKEFWLNRETLEGSMVKFKYMPGGTKDKPRHPVFLGFRHPEDL